MEHDETRIARIQRLPAGLLRVCRGVLRMGIKRAQQPRCWAERAAEVQIGERAMELPTVSQFWLILALLTCMACSSDADAGNLEGTRTGARAADPLYRSTDGEFGPVRPGIEVLLEDSLHLVAGKRVGLITNQTGVDSSGRSSIDRLFEHADVELVALFTPEHGIRGTADGDGAAETTLRLRIKNYSNYTRFIGSARLAISCNSYRLGFQTRFTPGTSRPRWMCHAGRHNGSRIVCATWADSQRWARKATRGSTAGINARGESTPRVAMRAQGMCAIFGFPILYAR